MTTAGEGGVGNEHSRRRPASGPGQWAMLAAAILAGGRSPGALAAQQPSTARPAASQPAPSDTSHPATATVTYVQGTSIYVGAGRTNGIDEGSELFLIRHDSVLATLKVRYLSSHQSASEVIKGVSDIVVGDTVRFYPRQPGSGTAVAATTATPKAPRRFSGPGLHGRIGLRYLGATTSNDTGGIGLGDNGFKQPSVDVRLDGTALWDTPLGVAVDMRTRRTTVSSTGVPDQVDGHTRIYRAALLWNTIGSGFRFTAGRQYLTAVTSVSLFDGALLEMAGRRFTVGGFGGVEPDPVNLGFSSAIQDYGGYVQVHSEASTSSPWSVTTGAVGSYTGGKTNREFAFMQAMLSTSVFSFFGLQELDYYRPWKVALGESSLSLTSTYASGSVRPARWISFFGSFDNRRNVRLYRDAVNPATQFDDAFRQGYGGGLQLLGRRLRASGEWRKSTGGAAGSDANSYTGTVGIDRLTPLRLGISARATWYVTTNPPLTGLPGLPNTTGQLYSLMLGFDPFPVLHVSLDGGLKNETNPRFTSRTHAQWYGIEADAALARAWFLSLSASRDHEPLNPGNSITTQVYGGITWRF
jgi:hypothetical protein